MEDEEVKLETQGVDHMDDEIEMESDTMMGDELYD